MNDFESAKNLIANADAVLITASNGLSIAEGYHIFADNDDFKKYFGGFRDKYVIPNLISGVFAELPPSEHERYMSQVHKYLIDDYHGSEVMKNLLEIVETASSLRAEGEAISSKAAEDCHVADAPRNDFKSDNYFILTTNADTHFQMNGFDKNRIFEAEGNFDTMEMQSPEWNSQFERFKKFVSENADKNLLVLELGVGPRNQYLKQPVMNLLLQNPKWIYLAMNMEKDIVIPRGLDERSLALAGDIAENLRRLL